MSRAKISRTNCAWLPTWILTVFFAAFGSARAAEPPTEGSLTGVVVGPEGKPVAGASVFIADFDDDAADAVPLIKTTSRKDGSFRLGPVGSGYRDHKDLHVLASGFVPLTVGDGTISVYSGTDTSLGEVRLGRGQVVAGQVLDADGTPCAGASVECQARRYTTAVFGSPLTPKYQITADSQGRFATPLLPVSFAGLTVRVAGREMPWIRVPWDWKAALTSPRSGSGRPRRLPARSATKPVSHWRA